MKQYSMHWNQAQEVWVAKVRKPDGSGWTTKWIPKEFGRGKEIDATAWLISWIQEWTSTFGTIAIKNYNVPAGKKTIKLLGPKWIELRYKDTGTKPNTLRGLEVSLKNWILDNEKFPHVSIQDIDMETGFTVQVMREWIESLSGSKSTKLQQIGTLKSLFRGCLEEEWINPEMANPLDKPAIKKVIKTISTNHRIQKLVSYLTPEQTNRLLYSDTPDIPDFRRLRYWVAVCTGMRDHEIQALTFEDLFLKEDIPHAMVSKQLDKIGNGPVVSYEKLADQGLSKDEIAKSKYAIVSLPKYGSVRLIPLHPELVKRLIGWQQKGFKNYVGRQPRVTDPVFPRSNISLKDNQEAGSFCFSMSAKLFRQDLKRLGLPAESNGLPLVFHSLRHTTASLLSEVGVYDALIGEILGHKARSVTRSSYVAKQLGAAYKAILELPLDGNLTSAIRIPRRIGL